jgi:hypothetical protein
MNTVIVAGERSELSHEPESKREEADEEQGQSPRQHSSHSHALEFEPHQHPPNNPYSIECDISKVELISHLMMIRGCSRESDFTVTHFIFTCKIELCILVFINY